MPVNYFQLNLNNIRYHDSQNNTNRNSQKQEQQNQRKRNVHAPHLNQFAMKKNLRQKK